MKNNFLRNLLTLLTGTVVAQLLSIISTPLKTRLYSVEDIGLLAYATTVMGIFTPLLMGQYEATVVLVKRHVYVALKLCLILCIVNTIFITFGISIYFCLQGNLQDNIALIISLPLYLLITGFINVLSSYNNRLREYKLLSKVNIYRSMANLFGIVILGIMGTGYIGLLFVTISSQLVALRKQAESLRDHWKKIFSVKMKSLWILAQKYWQQPVFGMSGTFVNGLSYSLLTIFIKEMYDFTTLGYYTMSVTLLGLPLGIVSSNMGKIFFEEATREKHENNVFINAFWKTTKYLAIGTVPFFMIIFILAPWGCELFLGDGWNVAGEYIRYLVPLFAIRFIVSPLTLAVVVSQKLHYNIIVQSLFLLLLGVCYYVTKEKQLPIEEFLTLINWSFAFVYVLFWGVCRRLAKSN